jgi:hypothetical protein
VTRAVVEASLRRLGLTVDDLEAVRGDVAERVEAMPGPVRLPARVAVRLSEIGSSGAARRMPGISSAHRLVDSLTAAVALDRATEGDRG